jgi:hypothetical protein
MTQMSLEFSPFLMYLFDSHWADKMGHAARATRRAANLLSAAKKIGGLQDYS